MKAEPCPACGASRAPKALVCPHCGDKRRSQFDKVMWVVIPVVGLLLIISMAVTQHGSL